MLNIVETFSGIGSQAEALEKANIPFRVSATVEWEIGAMYAYDIIHNGPQNLSDYRHHTKDSLVEEVMKYNLSTTGKELASLQSIAGMSVLQLKSILVAIERNRNLVDITQVHSEDLENEIDVLTYSFPCQDLSVSSFWWNNTSGITKGSGNRSSLLWEIERILQERQADGGLLPKFLLMENVPAILNQHHFGNFKVWMDELERLGYYNKIYTLNAKNFGIPQSRVRTYMLSVYIGNDQNKFNNLDTYFFENNLEQIVLEDGNIRPIGEFLRLDYTNSTYLEEAIASSPRFTESREKIYDNNVWLATDDVPSNLLARTLTTKQDRHPNAGLVTFSEGNELVQGQKYRNLTPRETFLLMGFPEEKYDLLLEHNFSVAENRKLIPDSKMYQLCGNSIVVDVLVEIFKQVDEINNTILAPVQSEV